MNQRAYALTDVLVERLAGDGVHVDLDACDTAALRADADDLRRGTVPLHMVAPVRTFAYVANDMRYLADLLDAS